MKTADVKARLMVIGQARTAWQVANARNRADVNALMRRMIHEAVAVQISDVEIARLTGFTRKAVRAKMREINLDPRQSVSLLSKRAADNLTHNAEIMGIEVSGIDLMSPLAYLPAGADLRTEVEEVSGNLSVGAEEERVYDIAAMLTCTWCSAEDNNPCQEWDKPITYLHDARVESAEKIIAKIKEQNQ